MIDDLGVVKSVGWHIHPLKKCNFFESKIACHYCGIEFVNQFATQYLCSSGCDFGLCEQCTLLCVYVLTSKKIRQDEELISFNLYIQNSKVFSIV